MREVRRHRPDVVMCLDPLRSRGHSHRDHRVSGQVTVDAVCTYAWRPPLLPEHITDEGLQPHVCPEIYLWGAKRPDMYVDISYTIELKVETLSRHAARSMMPDPWDST